MRETLVVLSQTIPVASASRQLLNSFVQLCLRISEEVLFPSWSAGKCSCVAGRPFQQPRIIHILLECSLHHSLQSQSYSFKICGAVIGMRRYPQPSIPHQGDYPLLQ